MTVTVSFFAARDEGKVLTFIYQDSPEFKHEGHSTHLLNHEILELLHRLGIADENERNRILEKILKHAPTVHRERCNLTAAQADHVRQFLPGPW